jgi:hypothetical protein
MEKPGFFKRSLPYPHPAAMDPGRKNYRKNII